MPRLPLWLLLGACLSSLAWAASPSQEFWEYMADFSDENGEVLDPLELDEVVTAREQEQPEIPASNVKTANVVIDGDAIKKAQKSVTSKSSAPATSPKGATL